MISSSAYIYIYIYISSTCFISIYHQHTSPAYIISIYHQHIPSAYITSIYHQPTLSACIISIYHLYISSGLIINTYDQQMMYDPKKADWGLAQVSFPDSCIIEIRCEKDPELRTYLLEKIAVVAPSIGVHFPTHSQAEYADSQRHGGGVARRAVG